MREFLAPRRPESWRRSLAVLVLGAVPVLAVTAPSTAAAALHPRPPRELALADVQPHLRALQQAADASGGNRATGTPGLEASTRYVTSVLRQAGYRPRLQRFQAPFTGVTRPPVLREVAPLARDIPATDYLVLDRSGSGTVDGAVVPVAAGCPAEGWPGVPAGGIVLVQQVQGCTLATLAAAARTSGAAALLVHRGAPAAAASGGAAAASGGGAASEDGSAPDGGAGGSAVPQLYPLPVIGITSPRLVEDLTATSGERVRLHLDVRTVSELRPAVNVLADTPRDLDRKDRQVVVVGAHLDSVGSGPGINDNGSSVAAVLAIAREVAAGPPTRRTIRFAFWGAEEQAFAGSTYYVQHLSDTERRALVADLNLEMLGSPNGVPFVADGDNSQFPAGSGVTAGPAGSGAIEALLAGYDERHHLPFARAALLARSDHVPFAAAGVPVGLLYSGVDGVKTPAEARLFGGTAGARYDPCYHQVCDRIETLDRSLLLRQARAAASAVHALAAGATLR